MRRPLVKQLTATTNAGNAVVVAFERVKHGTFWVVRYYAYTNNSGESVQFDPGIVGLGGFQAFGYQESLGTGQSDFARLYMVIGEDEAIAFQVKGSANKGEVAFRISGEVFDDTPEIVAVLQPPPAGGGK